MLHRIEISESTAQALAKQTSTVGVTLAVTAVTFAILVGVNALTDAPTDIEIVDVDSPEQE